MNYKILLVEDSLTDAELFEEMLVENTKHQFHIEVVERLSTAVDTLNNTKFDLIMLDLSLPDSQGLETFIRLQSYASGVPVIVLTGLDDESLAAQAVSLGAQDYLVKNEATTPLLVKSIRYAMERTRIQETLRSREETLSTLVSHIPDMVIRFDRELSIGFLNTAARNRLGISETDFTKKSIRDLGISGELVDLWDTTIQKVFENEQPEEIEFCLALNEVQSAYFRATIVPEFAENGAVTEVLFIARDITEHRRNQDALVESNARYEELFENAQDIIFTLNMNGEVTSVNRLVKTLLGYSSHEILGIYFFDLTEQLHIAQYNAEQSWNQLRDIEKNVDRTITFEAMVRSKSGENIPLEIKTRAILRHGKPIGLQGIARDIRDRKQVEAALRKSEEDFRLLAENSTDMISRHTTDGVYIYASPACYTLLGYYPHELVGRTAYEFFHPDDLDAILNNHDAVLKQPDTFTITYRICKKSGEYTWFETTSHQVRNPETDEIIEIQTTSRDVTERKIAEIEIQEAHEFAQNTVNSLSAHLAIVDENGEIIATNSAWNDYVLENGEKLGAFGTGANYFDAYQVVDITDEVALDFAEGLRNVLDGTKDYYSMEYQQNIPGDTSWFFLYITPYKGSGKAKAVIVHEDISELKAAEEQTKELNLKLERQNIELTSISEIGRALASTLDLREIYWTIFNSVARVVLDSPHIVIAAYDEETQEISCQFAIIDGAEQSVHEFPVMKLGDGPVSDAIRTKEIQIVDLNLVRDALNPKDRVIHIGDEQIPLSGIYVPLISGDRVKGVISFQSYVADAYDDINLPLISTITTQASVALENGILYQQVQDYANTLEERVVDRTRKLEQLNKRMSAILNNASDAILLITEEGRIEITNPAFNKLFGYDVDELFDQPLYQIADINSREMLLSTMALLQENKTPQRIQALCKHKDGATFDVELSLASVPNNESHMVCTIFDISQFKAVERVKDQFISTVNHELRTPLGSIILTASALEKYYSKLTDEKRQQKILQIQEQGKILAELIDSILDIARLESVEARADVLTQVDMCQVVTQIVTELQVNTENKFQNMVLTLK